MTIFGSDLSHFDSPDVAPMFAEGIVFQTHKAGGDATDAEIGAWWKVARPHRDKVLLGAYWVLYPGDPAGRADAFLARLDSQCPGWRDGPFILQADCEQWLGRPSTVPPVSEINAFCDRLVQRAPKLLPIVYAPEWVYGGKVSALRYPLWASSYVTGSGGFRSLYPGDGSSRWGAYGGKTPSVLQYTSSATIGGQTTSDANAFRGTLDELTALVAPGWTVSDVNLTDKYGDKAWPGRDVADRLSDDAKLRDVLWGDEPGTKAAALPADSPLAQLISVPARVAALEAKVDALGTPVVDQAALDAAVAAGVAAVLVKLAAAAS